MTVLYYEIYIFFFIWMSKYQTIIFSVIINHFFIFFHFLIFIKIFIFNIITFSSLIFYIFFVFTYVYCYFLILFLVCIFYYVLHLSIFFILTLNIYYVNASAWSSLRILKCLYFSFMFYLSGNHESNNVLLCFTILTQVFIYCSR